MEEVKELPADVWIHIFQTGIERSNLNVQDICSLSITCKKFNQLSDEDILWSSLVAHDFPSTDNTDACKCSASSKKSFYKHQLQTNLKQKIASAQLGIARVDSLLREAKNSFRRSSYVSLMAVDKKLEKLAKEFIEYTSSAEEHQEAVKLLEGRLQTKNGKFKEHFTSLVNKIKTRLHKKFSASAGAGACTSMPPAVSSDLLDDFIARVEIKLDELLKEQQFSQENVQQCYRQRDDYASHIATLTSRLAAFGVSDGGGNEQVTDDEVIGGMQKLTVSSVFDGGGSKETGNMEVVGRMEGLSLIDYLFADW